MAVVAAWEPGDQSSEEEHRDGRQNGEEIAPEVGHWPQEATHDHRAEREKDRGSQNGEWRLENGDWRLERGGTEAADDEAREAQESEQGDDVQQGVDPGRERDLVIAQAAPEGSAQPVEVGAQVGQGDRALPQSPLRHLPRRAGGIAIEDSLAHQPGDDQERGHAEDDQAPAQEASP